MLKVNREQFDIMTEKGLVPSEHSLCDFSEAVYEQNTIEDVLNFDNGEADAGDLKSWSIDSGEWVESIRKAIEYSMWEYLNDNA